MAEKRVPINISRETVELLKDVKIKMAKEERKFPSYDKIISNLIKLFLNKKG